MKLIVSFGLLAVIAVATAHHEDDDSPCAKPLYESPAGQIGCLAIVPRYYHDHASGECKEFSYDGCTKNENHFETKEECEKTCNEWHQKHKDHDHQHKHSADCKHDHEHHDHEHHDHDHAHHHH